MTNNAKAAHSHTFDDFDNEELLALARLDMERGFVEGALGKIKRVLSDPSPSPEALSIGGRIYAQLGLLDRAKSLFKRYVEQYPQAVHERFELGMVHFDAGQAQEAKTIWEGVLAERPEHPPALFYHALVLAQQGQSAQAKPELERLMRSIPPDNLYFGRAKDLLQALENGRLASKNGSTNDPAHKPKSPYETEH